LQRLEIENAVAGRTDQPVAVDFSNRADRRNLRLGVVRQRGDLRQPVENLLQGLVVGELERELQLDVGKPIKRDGADRGEITQPRDLRLDRDRDVALDFLGR
jgi:hypothetical protein